MTTPILPALKLSRRLLLLTACLALAGPGAFPQDAVPTFDVATIKPHEGRMTMTGLRSQPDNFAGTLTLAMLVQTAYGLQTEDQVSGGPDWTRTDWFDFQAKIGEADLAAMQKLSPADASARRQLMFRALLAERFKLQSHSATKQVPVYDLIVTKASPRLQDAATDTSDHLEKGADGKPLTGYLRFLKDTSVAQGYPMKSLANLLSQPVAGVGRPVHDKTGLTSTYDFVLNWSVYSASAHAAAPPNGSASSDPADGGPSIFTALGELGLKLQPTTGPIETIVIDHVEKPTSD
ncbi:MAG TPA: TIGR03435 family protein [Acidobacteriaceae bacterium]|jgi:uncharacterized protein (TIGR03435 family)